MIGRVQMVEIDGLLVKTLAHADFAGFQTVEIGGKRAGLCCRAGLLKALLLWAACAWSHGDVAGHDFGNVQRRTEQLGRFPIKAEAADFDIRTVCFNQPFVAFKTFNQRAFSVPKRFDAEP